MNDVPVSYPDAAPRTPLKFGRLELPTRYLLSPLAGYTNLPFRRIVRELGGVGLATTDLVNARGLLTRNRKTLDLIATCAGDEPLAVQIFGTDPAVMAEVAAFLEERGVQSVDINMGCPVARVTKDGSGAALMCRGEQTVRLVERVVQAVRIPVTVKMRLGWDDTQITAPEFARAFEQVGVAAVAIHGRTRAQGFRGLVSREGIRQVVQAVRRIPVIGNGDVRNIADAARMFVDTGCQGISIGRGALANPWFFSQLAAWERSGRHDPSGDFDSRLELLNRQFEYLCEQKGIEHAIPAFRRMGHWYLKWMRVPASLRNNFQQACTIDAFNQALRQISETGPLGGLRNGPLPDLPIPVPSGPVERW